MLETLLFLIVKGMITGAASKGGQVLMDKLKKHFGESLGEKIGDAYLKASEVYSDLADEVIIDNSLEDDPYYKNLIYSFNIINGEELSDYNKRMSKLFLLEIFKTPELTNQVFNIKLDNIQKGILEVKNDTSEIIRMIRDQSNLESIQNKLNIPKFEITLTEDDFAIQEMTHISKREATVKNIITELDNCKWLTITGEILSGKTELLKLCINKLSKENRQTLYISINKYHNEQDIITYLNVMYAKLQKAAIPFLLVIDNLPSLNRNSLIVNHLKGIMGLNVKILSSSYYSLPISLQDSNINNIKEISIPEFTQSEVEEIISTFNNNERIINLYSEAILSLGRFNPAIISALCYYLNEKNWKSDTDTFMAMLQGDFSTDFRLEINNLLKDNVDSPNSRELLNRLQIHIGSFKEEVVALVGNVPPAINNLNEKFLSLIGLWIQRKQDNYFNISPLVGIINKGTPDVINPVRKTINLLLGRKLLEKIKLNQFDIAYSILYFNNAEEYDEAGYLLIRALQEYMDKPNLFKDTSLNSIWIDLSLPVKMNDQIKMHIRILQIINNKNINKDVSYLLNDLEEIIEKTLHKGENTFLANSFLGVMYANQTDMNPKAAKYLLNAFKESKNLDSEMTEELLRLESLSASDDMIWLTFSQLNNEQDIIAWFDVFKSENNINITEFESSNFADACIFFLCNRFEKNAEEEININSNCDNILTKLSLIYRLSLEEKLFLIARNLLSLIINLYDLIGNKEKAYSLYVKNTNYFDKNIDKVILHSLIIKVLLFNFNDRVDELISEYNLCINKIDKTDKGNTYVLDALVLLMIYYRDIDISESLKYSQLAHDYSIYRSEFDELTQIRIIGEHSYTLWLNGEKEEALRLAEEGYELLLNVYSDSDEYKVLIVKYTGVLIRHLYFVICNKEEATDSFAQPSIGLFHLKINDNKLLEVYHPSRESIAAYMFFEIFNLLGTDHLLQTKKWALTCYNMNKKIDKNPFSAILLHTVPYLAMQHRYNEVVDIFYESNNEIKRINLGESELEKIATSVQPERETILTKIPLKEESNDEFLLAFYIMPLLLDAMTFYIKENDSKPLLEVKNILKYHLDFCKDPVIIKDCIHVLRIFIEDKQLRHDEDVNSNSSILRMIIYFLSSIKSTGSQAFEMQINFIISLDRDYRSLFKNEYYYLLYPFFKTFWLKKIESNKSEFTGYDHLNKQGVNYIENGEGDNLKRLFHVISDHVSIKRLNTEQKNWLDSYDS